VTYYKSQTRLATRPKSRSRLHFRSRSYINGTGCF